MLWMAIVLGGGLGALARHLVNELVQHRTFGAPFSYGIFVVNVTGCLAIGLFAGALAGGRIHASPEVRSFVVIGLLGGYTTFSSLSLDTLVLVQAGQLPTALLNVFGQVSLGILAVWAGFAVAR
jgi:CrcB protein